MYAICMQLSLGAYCMDQRAVWLCELSMTTPSRKPSGGDSKHTKPCTEFLQHA